ncbi:sensor histidine kinase [Haloimpatiens sp. FM7315]|uniref:sensor histidine kinase n=1 Tax=Haloimpatiens sp. FM7315 TaxID=3298609 RepID=UPI00370BD311
MIWFLIIIIVVLLILLINDKRKIKLISLKLKNIIDKKSNERIKFNNLSMDNKEIVRNINRFLDKYQEISLDNKNYKEQHEKMISNISHDIRTPLTAILGYIDLLMEENISEEKKGEYIKIVSERGNALKDLIEEFFKMAKLECNDVELKIEEVNVSEILRQDIITFMSKINENNIIPEIKIGEDEIFALADENALHRIVNNLISNSLKYGYDGKVIGIELKDYEKCIKLSVYDRGKGIEKSEIAHIFDRLYTEEKSRNRKYQGSGLGLAIVKKLVEDMSGSIEVSSIPFEKTCFTVTLPKKIDKIKTDY